MAAVMHSGAHLRLWLQWFLRIAEAVSGGSAGEGSWGMPPASHYTFVFCVLQEAILLLAHPPHPETPMVMPSQFS